MSSEVEGITRRPLRCRSAPPRNDTVYRNSVGISSGCFATLTPAASRALTLSAAVPAPPSMMATCVSHAFSGRGGLTGDEGGDGLGHLCADEFRGPFLFIAADLADHDDFFGFWIVFEHFQHVGEVCAVDRVAADADAGGRAHAEVFHGIKHFVSQCAGARDHADVAGDGDVAGDDSHFGFSGCEQAGAVRSDQARAFLIEVIAHTHHVVDDKLLR